MKAVTQIHEAETEEQNYFELFIQHLDSLYFEGYAVQLADEDPALFDFELSNFLTII